MVRAFLPGYPQRASARPRPACRATLDRTTRSDRALPRPVHVLIAFNKPYGVICKFSPEPGRRTLADYVDVPHVYPAGRLDTDSEGLLLLTDDGSLQAHIANPRFKLPKVYWAQVEGIPSEEALARLRAGVDLGEFRSAPCSARQIDEPEGLWPREPPIRWRAKIATAWIELTLREGKNRQVRRMTAHVGFPTLRLIRASVGDISVRGLAPATWREIDAASLRPQQSSRGAHVRAEAMQKAHSLLPSRSRK
ncbi:MAG: pseudouridine synthase [Proteobacteria bacterium]|nr:pseudouridine synthase [Pseudomonadota bacterium]